MYWEEFPIFAKWNCVDVCIRIYFDWNWFAAMFSYHLECCMKWWLSIWSYMCEESAFLTWLCNECCYVTDLINQCRASLVSVVRWSVCSGRTAANASLVRLPASAGGMTASSAAALPFLLGSSLPIPVPGILGASGTSA